MHGTPLRRMVATLRRLERPLRRAPVALERVFDDPPPSVGITTEEVDALIDQFDKDFPEWSGLLRATVEGSE